MVKGTQLRGTGVARPASNETGGGTTTVIHAVLLIHVSRHVSMWHRERYEQSMTNDIRKVKKHYTDKETLPTKNILSDITFFSMCHFYNYINN